MAATSTGKKIVGGAVGISIGFFVLASVLVEAFDMFFAADTSSWDDGTASLWTVLPLLAIVVFLGVLAGAAMKYL